MDSAVPVNRRIVLKRAGALAVAFGALEAVGPFSFAPERVGASIVPSDIQFDISDFLAVPPQNYGTDVQFQLPPVHTVFLTAALERTPTRADQAEMNRALGVLEQHYPWGATHLVTFVAYGLPYFGRLPRSLVARHVPRLADGRASGRRGRARGSPACCRGDRILLRQRERGAEEQRKKSRHVQFQSHDATASATASTARRQASRSTS